MKRGLMWLRSVIFVAQMYLVMALMAAVLMPLSALSNGVMYWSIKRYTDWVRLSARWIVGIRSEIRGNIPKGDAIIAAKHQSFFDVLLLVNVLPRPRFVMKKELSRIPIIGFYAMRMGCIPIDRNKGSKAMRGLKNAVEGSELKGQLVIFPQGTRVPPEGKAPYKSGVAMVHQSTDMPVIPVAGNVGYFWPRRGISRTPGTAILEFLTPLPSDLERTGLMQQLEVRIESASAKLTPAEEKES